MLFDYTVHCARADSIHSGMALRWIMPGRVGRQISLHCCRPKGRRANRDVGRVIGAWGSGYYAKRIIAHQQALHIQGIWLPWTFGPQNDGALDWSIPTKAAHSKNACAAVGMRRDSQRAPSAATNRANRAVYSGFDRGPCGPPYP